jgi:hypothetical protein
VRGWIVKRIDSWTEERLADADHVAGSNVFSARISFIGDMTGQTILLAVFVSCGTEDMPATDRGPSYGYFEYTFGTGPKTYEDGEDGPPFPPGVNVDPIMTWWGGVPTVHWQDPLLFTYHGDDTVVTVDITIETQAGGVVVGPAAAMENSWDYYWTYLWTPFPNHGPTLVTYTVHYAAGPPLVIEFPILIDPSGFVYDEVTGNPVVGATVTLFYSPDGTPGSFVEVNEAAPPPLISPAVNPQSTDATGHYGWDVQEGYYYVHVEKAGYFPKDSPVVYVPPEVTALNVYLKPRPAFAIPAIGAWGAAAAMAALAVFGALMLRRRRAYQR